MKRTPWQRWEESNFRIAQSKCAVFPLDYTSMYSDKYTQYIISQTFLFVKSLQRLKRYTNKTGKL